jgi:hypothetical protein
MVTTLEYPSLLEVDIPTWHLACMKSTINMVYMHWTGSSAILSNKQCSKKISSSQNSQSIDKYSTEPLTFQRSPRTSPWSHLAIVPVSAPVDHPAVPSLTTIVQASVTRFSRGFREILKQSFSIQSLQVRRERENVACFKRLTFSSLFSGCRVMSYLQTSATFCSEN